MSGVSKETIDLFYELFRGREDVVLVDPADPTRKPYQEKFDRGTRAKSWVQGSLILNEHPSVGIYPIIDGVSCRWICSDFDDENAEKYAWKLHDAWASYGIKSWVETSKSKGYHVWVFIADWCPAIVARRAALWVHQVSDVPAVEVNPKQEMLGEGNYGNCVRLPYWAGRGMQRMTMVNGDSTLHAGGDWFWSLENFVSSASLAKTPVAHLKDLAVKWMPPAPPETRSEGGYGRVERDGGEGEWIRCKAIYKGSQDVHVGSRDDDLYAVAMYMRGIDLEFNEAVQVMHEIWNDQVEQSAGHPYPLKDAIDKVRRAYASR